MLFIGIMGVELKFVVIGGMIGVGVGRVAVMDDTALVVDVSVESDERCCGVK